MAVRAGQYVSRSSIFELLPILQEIFAREPPVISRQAHVTQPLSIGQQKATRPPPIPPLPPELGRPESVSSQSGSRSQPPPPPRPPKATENHAEWQSQQANGAPPVPPHPGRHDLETRHQPSDKHVARDRLPAIVHDQQYQPQRNNSLSYDHGPASQHRNQNITVHQPIPQSPYNMRSTMPSASQPFSPQASHSLSYPLQGQDVPPPQPAPTERSAGQATWQPQQGHPHSTGPPYQQAPSQYPPKPKVQEDLLTTPFETTLPASDVGIAPPPIPPNPQKDALLQTLSETLTQRVQTTHASNMSAIPPLRAQQAAMNETLNNINHEMSQLNDLQGLLDSNERILRQAMLDADKVLEDAKRRDVPAVEEVLVAPTVVAGQLYENVVEERVLEECRTVVGKALDRGRIGGDVWAKQTRSLAREEFLKKALIKKIAHGMGLAQEEKWD
ncbi:MAG: hypothetical protein Q9182_002145 [Xanthomendoza sp. 2 TL-2023]